MKRSPAKLLFSFYKLCLLQAIFILTFGLGIVYAGLIWGQTVSTMGNSIAYAICVDGTGAYVVGITNGFGATTRWRVEKRDLNGNQIWDNAAEAALGSAYAVTFDANFVYVGGTDQTLGCWRIQKRNKTTGVLQWTRSVPANLGQVYAIAVDASGIYVAGWVNVGGSWRWRVEKRDLAIGLVVSWSHSGDAWSDPVNAIAVNATDIYAAGDWGGNVQWRIEKSNLAGSLSGWPWPQIEDPSTFNDFLYAIALDATGFYLAGTDHNPNHYQWRMEKRDLASGNVIWGDVMTGLVESDPSPPDNSAARGIGVDTNAIYVAGHQGPGSNEKWRIEKRNKTDGSLICVDISDPTINSDRAYAIAVDATGMYVAGYQAGGIWRVEKRGLACSYIDCGLRVYDGTTIVPIACEPLGTLTSPLRIGKNGNVYGVALVDTADSNASKVRVKTSSGIPKSLRKYP